MSLHHHHAHEHSDNPVPYPEKRLFLATALNVLITVFQIVGGILSGSLALITDALHNLSDGVAILISYLAIRISRRPTSEKYTFGQKRAEILAAAINAGVMVAICIFLFKEAYHRLVSPVSIDSRIVIGVAAVGLVANILVILLLQQGSKENLNIRSAYLHMLGDALSSLAVIFGGVMIYFLEVYWIDSLLTVLISIYLLKEAVTIIKEATNVLMMGTPDSISLENIRMELEKIEEVKNIHHVHAWRLGDQDIHFEAHVDVKHDMKVSETTKLCCTIEKRLQTHYRINHVTLQFETEKCESLDLVNHDHRCD